MVIDKDCPSCVAPERNIAGITVKVGKVVADRFTAIRREYRV